MIRVDLIKAWIGEVVGVDARELKGGEEIADGLFSYVHPQKGKITIDERVIYVEKDEEEIKKGWAHPDLKFFAAGYNGGRRPLFGKRKRELFEKGLAARTRYSSS